MYLYRDDTLAYYKNSLALAKQDMSLVSAKAVGDSALVWVAPQFHETHMHPRPEHEALTFYALNHAFAEIQKRYSLHEKMDPKDAQLAAMYLTRLTEVGRRIFYYLTLISTRESRHMQGKAGFANKLKSQFGAAFHEFHKGIKGKESFLVAKTFMNYPPNVPIGKYLEGLTFIFNEGSFSGGYGGPNWGRISHCAEQYVKGEISLEIMIDTAWTLAHNGGVVFDKGMLYRSEYAHGSELKTILDVQRSGQIPQLFHSHFQGDVVLQTMGALDHQHWFPLLMEQFPELNTYVDWFKVEKLGALGNYKSQQQAQVKKYGKPVKSKAEVEKEKKQKALEALEAKKALELEASKVYISENEFFYKTQRKAA